MNMKPEQLLNSTPKGLYCPAGDFYIDPVRPVARALITHGHSDHARAGAWAACWADASGAGVSSLRAIHTSARPPASMKPGTFRI